MSSDEASKLVFAAALVEVAVVAAAARRGSADEETTFRALWAIGGLSVGLSLLADFAPQLAGPFALLVAIALVAKNPGQLGSWAGFGDGQAGSPAPLGPRPEEGTRGAGRRAPAPPAHDRIRQSSNGRGGV